MWASEAWNPDTTSGTYDNGCTHSSVCPGFFISRMGVMTVPISQGFAKEQTA